MSSFSLTHWIITAAIGWALYKALTGNKKRAARFCKSCGHTGRTDTHTPGSIWIEVVLWLCLIVPGLVYSIWRASSRKAKCERCGSFDLVPADSPVAVAAQQQLGIVPTVRKDFQ